MPAEKSNFPPGMPHRFVFENNHLIVGYDVPSTKGNLVQDKRLYAALEKDMAMKNFLVMDRIESNKPHPARGRFWPNLFQPR